MCVFRQTKENVKAGRIRSKSVQQFLDSVGYYDVNISFILAFIFLFLLQNLFSSFLIIIRRIN